MFKYIKDLLTNEKKESYSPPIANSFAGEKFSENLEDTTVRIRQLCNNTADLIIQRMEISSIKVAFVMCEGMFDLDTTSKLIITPLSNKKFEKGNFQELFEYVNTKTMLATDQKVFFTMGELFNFIMSGFVVMLIDGKNCGIAMGIQGFTTRSISEPTSEMNIRGSQEGFIEALRINMTMVRRRLKSPNLCFELMSVGINSQTAICLVYRTDLVSRKLLNDIKYRLKQIKLDNILESGYIQPFLERKPFSIFSGIGSTERPDTLCAKVCEGRVGILVDGTPFALTIPHLFVEHFQSFDDYTTAPFFATIIRWIKYISFFISTLLPGMYVAIATFHPELFPTALLYNVAASEKSTPFPLVLEALIIHLFYEIMREAGLRLPRAVGHAVSIIGALIIGDAAVTAGLIGAPMVMVVALTAISSFVIPSLYESISFLRFCFIFAGGAFGLYGISLMLCIVFINLCAINDYGIPSTSPASPMFLYSFRDIIMRSSWVNLGKADMNIKDLPGSELQDEGDDEQ